MISTDELKLAAEIYARIITQLILNENAAQPLAAQHAGTALDMASTFHKVLKQRTTGYK